MIYFKSGKICPLCVAALFSDETFDFDSTRHAFGVTFEIAQTCRSAEETES